MKFQASVVPRIIARKTLAEIDSPSHACYTMMEIGFSSIMVPEYRGLMNTLRHTILHRLEFFVNTTVMEIGNFLGFHQSSNIWVSQTHCDTYCIG